MFELPTPQASKTLTVRLPVAMYQQIADLARKQRRSLNNQLLVLLEQQLPSPLDEDQTTAPPASPYPHDRRPIALTYALGGTDAVAGD
ncbi:MAG TPA: Arc family DNA-binding protein [Herpetosiphonaceae bacterium]|nr:Arc family DNA-binding protein [Herpetosiphonaceae bacterium]